MLVQTAIDQNFETDTKRKRRQSLQEQQEEVCLFCKLTALFNRYNLADEQTIEAKEGQHVYANVLKPTYVRESLATLYGDSVGMHYKEGQMGDS